MSSEQTKRILIVDDDNEIRELLGSYLGQNGYETLSLENGEQLIKQLQTTQIDLIILDLMMPGEDGFSLCRQVRIDSDVPIIMLTASAEETDRIVGLELGADDYVAKPFNPRELLARIKAVLRRSRSAGTSGSKGRYFCFSEWRLDTVNRDLIGSSGEVIPLSGADYNLLLLFLENPNKVLNRDDLLGATRGRESSPYDRSIDVQLSRLRQRLGEDAKDPHIIKTVRGSGYVLSVEVEREM
ncbi:two-component system, OmpR family, response regulator [Amphritea atlantica]|uniref:Two-component system, OmpR family, response regulator n=1 Tax=Amphritea atlantica TaxID=355243 RepID=A0A1H9GK53_9GAMM|nr:response regulator [Amphritea atlantica]SEQ50475.1 two-component system, OmpR family, response regulator [Amphritea atlantica]